MDNILKVCDENYCIEVYNNVSNVSHCDYKIYPSDKHTFPIDKPMVIITLSTLLFLITLLCIILICCYCHLRKKIKSNIDSKLANPSTNGTFRQQDTISQASEYQAIPGHIDIDNVTYFLFDRQIREEAANASATDNSPIPTPILDTKMSEEVMLVDKAFAPLCDRASYSRDSNKKNVPCKMTQIKHRDSFINIPIEVSSSNSSDCTRTPIPNVKIHDSFNSRSDIGNIYNDEYAFLPDSRKSTFKDRVYPAEYELNHRESNRDKSDFSLENLHTNGTQDDMIYKTTDDIDFERITVDDFARLSTIRLMKFFAPQEIKYSDIDFKDQEFIGQGSVGQVFRAKYNGVYVAVKKLSDKYFKLSATDLQNFKREASIMQKVGGHKHIARMYGFCTLPEICIVTEYYSRRSIHDIIKNGEYKNELNILRKMQMCIEASLGILHLHQQNVVHRDISARNLLVDQNWTVVVADLGMSRLKHSQYDKKKCKDKSKNQAHFGPIKWMAPESITMQIYSEKTDVYSFGITLYEIFSELDPYPNLLPLEAGVKVVSKGLRPKINHLQFAKEVPDLVELMEALWKHEPNQRPKFTYICESLNSIKDELE